MPKPCARLHAKLQIPSQDRKRSSHGQTKWTCTWPYTQILLHPKRRSQMDLHYVRTSAHLHYLRRRLPHLRVHSIIHRQKTQDQHPAISTAPSKAQHPRVCHLRLVRTIRNIRRPPGKRHPRYGTLRPKPLNRRATPKQILEDAIGYRSSKPPAPRFRMARQRQSQ